MSHTAVVFPGQGAHYVGMGRDLYDAYPAARAVFDAADDVLGFSVSDLCFNGPLEALTDTVNQQPALLATSIAVWEVLRATKGAVLPAPLFAAGHSLGEYSALVAVGALDLADGLRLVRERGRLMKEAGQRTPGGMAAVLGLDDSVLEACCLEASRQCGGRDVVCANYNSAGQVVLSGDKVALESAINLAKERGARRAIPLAVTIASHSPLMAEAAAEFAKTVAATPFRDAVVPVVANVTARPIRTAAEIRDELVRQLTSPVRWTESVQFMVAQGVTTFYEIGPKDVLTGLIRRIDGTVSVAAVGTAQAVAALS